MTITTVTAPPPELAAWVAARPRQDAIVEHWVRTAPDWWQRNLPAELGVVTAGKRDDRWGITRGDLFQHAAGVVEDTTGRQALNLLWHTLAWGTGTRHRHNKARIAAVAADPDRLGRVLRDAAEASRTDPAGAFQLLRPGGRNAIKTLGPAFLTNYLYFAGGGNPAHPSLIVDSQVQATLHRAIPDEPLLRPNFLYGSSAYDAALKVMADWARLLSTGDRPVAPDEVERWAFAADA